MFDWKLHYSIKLTQFKGSFTGYNYTPRDATFCLRSQFAGRHLQSRLFLL